MTTALAALCAIALLVVSVLTLRRRRTATPAERAWQRFCARLARLGIARNDWEGPLAFADRVARQRPELAPLCREAAGLYARLHYARATHPLRQELRELKDCTRRLPSSWRTRSWKSWKS